MLLQLGSMHVKLLYKIDRFYPYDDLLKKKLERSKSRRVISDQAMPILESIFNKILPVYCIEQIIFFCSDDELAYLIKSSFV